MLYALAYCRCCRSQTPSPPLTPPPVPPPTPDETFEA